jgi:hypothetical protein
MSRRPLALTKSLLVALFLTVAGCGAESESEYGPDTCTGGDNMSSPRLARGLETDAAGAFVTIEWDPGTGRGAALPASYYHEVTLARAGTRLGDGTVPDHQFVAEVNATGDRQIVVRLTGLDALWNAGTDAGASDGDAGVTPPRRVALLLHFPDRAKHIDCTHPGMNDDYYLTVTLTFSAPSQLEKSTFEQRVSVGAV